MISDDIITPPGICGLSEVVLAHQQMQRHRACRIDRCGWKWVAYYTLVHYGRIAPQGASPRERAHSRGIPFPTNGIGPSTPGTAPEAQTLEQVLDALTRLASSHTYFGCGG